MRLTQEQALARLQATVLDILDAIATFCAKHDIEWFLDSGTTLGAMRHNGFIPWDDDADVGMLRPEWERFVALARDEGFTPGFSVHTARDTEGFDGIMAKVFKDGTTFIDQRAEDGGFHQGIFVDVFPYDSLLADPRAARRQLRGARLWTYMLYLRNSGNNKVPHGGALGVLEQGICHVAHPIARALFSQQRVIEGFERSIPGPSDRVSDIYAPLPYALLHPKSTLVPVSSHRFEGRVFPMPADPDDYLTVKYGDWHELPPVESRKSHLPVLIDFGDGDIYESEGGG